MPRILLLPTAILSRLRNTRQRPGRGNGFRMMKRKTLLIIIGVMLIFVSLPVQASMPVPDLLPFGQLDLDEEPVQGAEGTEGGEPAAENGTPVDGGTQEDAEESAMEILEEDTIGSGMILIAGLRRRKTMRLLMNGPKMRTGAIRIWASPTWTII